MATPRDTQGVVRRTHVPQSENGRVGGGHDALRVRGCRRAIRREASSPSASLLLRPSTVRGRLRCPSWQTRDLCEHPGLSQQAAQRRQELLQAHYLARRLDSCRLQDTERRASVTAGWCRARRVGCQPARCDSAQGGFAHDVLAEMAAGALASARNRPRYSGAEGHTFEPCRAYSPLDSVMGDET